MNPHTSMRQMKTGCRRPLISLSRIQVRPLRLSLQWVRHHFKQCMRSIALTSYTYPSAAHSWRSWASQLDQQQNVCAARVRSLHAPAHYTAILGVPILRVPTLIDFWTNELIKKQLHFILWNIAFKVLQWLMSWAPNPRVVSSIPPGSCCYDFEQVTLSPLLQCS